MAVNRWFASDGGKGEIFDYVWQPRLHVDDDWSVGLDLWFRSREACEEFIRQELVNTEGPKDEGLAWQ